MVRVHSKGANLPPCRVQRAAYSSWLAADSAALLYDIDIGTLAFDADGLGGTDAVVVATLAGQFTLGRLLNCLGSLDRS